MSLTNPSEHSITETEKLKKEIEVLQKTIDDLKSKLGMYNTMSLDKFNAKHYPEGIACKVNYADAIFYFTLLNIEAVREFTPQYFKIYFGEFLKITKENDYSIFDNKITTYHHIEHRNRQSYVHAEDAFITFPKSAEITLISKAQYEHIVSMVHNTFNNLYVSADSPINDLNELY
jgi:hypothetical protein